MTKQLLLVCPLLMTVSAAWGASVCTATTLDVYTKNDAGGFSCTLGGLTFSNFKYIAPTGIPTEATVQVTPTNDGTNVGFFFTGDFSASAGMSSDAVLSYQVSSGSTAAILADSVTMTDAVSGAGALATIVEGICTTQPGGNGACMPASNAYSLDVYDNASHPPAVTSASAMFGAAVSDVFVTKNIVTAGGSGSASISKFENTVQIGGGGGPGGGSVPEPASFFTLGSGLLATCALLRRKVRRS